MGIFSLEVLHRLRNTVSTNADAVKTLYSCLASTLGFDTMLLDVSGNYSLCQKSCNGTDNGTKCINSSCFYPCLTLYTDFGAVFATFSYLLLLISTIQLILAMIHDSFQEDKHRLSRWQKAFRVTIQKCLLGAVILATGSRAIYYTVQSLIPDKWGDILLNVYYPSLLSAFSLLICFWAEFFYTPSNLESRDFLIKHRYSIVYLIFNIMVYLLLIADIIATPLISDQEQIQMSGIIGTIFAFFLFMTLIGFLHFAIRLFFRPDWQPLFIQLAVLRINLRQQFASVLGVVSNAVMQGLIISLLIFNMVVRYIPVDSYNLYICAVVIRVTELIMPFWFCCSLWNFKQPKRLWILNPGLILKPNDLVDDVERKSLIGTQSDGCTQYGTASLNSVGSDDDAIARSSVAGEDGCCWVCLGNDDPSDLFYPCNCRLHRKCIKQWVAKRASNANITEKEYMRCQVCRKKYHTKSESFLCFFRGMERRHWLLLLGAGVLVLTTIIGLVLFAHYSQLERNRKILAICCVAIFAAAIIKCLGFKMTLVLRKSKSRRQELQGLTVEEWKKKKEKKQQLEQAYQIPSPPQPVVASSGARRPVIAGSGSMVRYDAPVHPISVGTEGTVKIVTATSNLGTKNSSKSFHSSISVDSNPS